MLALWHDLVGASLTKEKKTACEIQKFGANLAPAISWRENQDKISTACLVGLIVEKWGSISEFTIIIIIKVSQGVLA